MRFRVSQGVLTEPSPGTQCNRCLLGLRVVTNERHRRCAGSFVGFQSLYEIQARRTVRVENPVDEHEIEVAASNGLDGFFTRGSLHHVRAKVLGQQAADVSVVETALADIEHFRFVVVYDR